MQFKVPVLAATLFIVATMASAAQLNDSRIQIETEYQTDVAVCKELDKTEIQPCLNEAKGKKKNAYITAWAKRDPAQQTRIYYGDLNTNKPKIEKDYKDDVAFCKGLGKAESATCQREALERKKQAIKSVMTAPHELQTACSTCGMITEIREVENPGQGTLLGQIGGGVVGGALGNQVGKGNGRTIATIVGAVGGAIAGNAIEKQVKSGKYYEVAFRLNNGEEKTMTFESNAHGFKVGDKIRFENNQLLSQQ